MKNAILCLSMVMFAAPASADATTGSHHVRVLVLNFDPFVPSMGGQRLHDALGWRDPRALSQQYITELSAATGGKVQHTIVQWTDLDEIPIKADGYQYTIDEYVANWQNGGGWHSPDTMAYAAEINSHGIPALINADVIDEVWFFGAPYFGFWEAAMAGPGSFFINGGTYPNVNTTHAFAIMGFNYERGVAEMLHSLGHRAENSVARVFGGWHIHNPQTDWDWFAANAGQTSALPGVGNIHYPANGQQDYDYSNPTPVLSSALDWASYPNLTGATTMVSVADWSTSANRHLGYMRFWFGLLPNAPGLHPVHGRANDWYAYIYDWLSFYGNGQPRYAPPQSYCTSTVNSTGSPAAIAWSGSTSVSANDLVLEAEDCPPAAPGLFFFGSNEVQLPMGDGWRCVAGQVSRLPMLAADGTGRATWPFDLTTPGTSLIDVGSTRHFQLWYRDPLGPGAAGHNTSDALTVVFCP